MRRSITLTATLLAVGVFIAAGCSVSFQDEPTKNKTFPCQSDSDCIGENQTCKEVGAETKLCVSGTITNCGDKDGDGYGTQDLASCPACEQDGQCGAEFKDCNDQDANINPGAIEKCDGKDNDCDGVKDKDVGSKSCEEADVCPLTNPPSGVSYGCRDINGDGTKECYRHASVQGGKGCCFYDNNKDAAGVCKNGSWTEVPQYCRDANASCP